LNCLALLITLLRSKLCADFKSSLRTRERRGVCFIWVCVSLSCSCALYGVYAYHCLVCVPSAWGCSMYVCFDWSWKSGGNDPKRHSLGLSGRVDRRAVGRVRIWWQKGVWLSCTFH
jgi:hypothetical protein